MNYQELNFKDNQVKSDKTIVLLHGWGQNIEMMEPIANNFQEHRTIIIDLPGHGNTKVPEQALSLNEIVELVHELLNSLNIKKPILIGHSFGGKISLIYSSIYEVEKLVLLAAPYKKSTKKPKLSYRIFRNIRYLPGGEKILNKYKEKKGSTDYRNASPIMRDTLVKHVNTDAVENAKNIKCPTLIIWGTKDDAVPVNDAYDLEKLIKDSGVVIYKNSTHYAYLENLPNLIKVLKVFFK